MEREFKKYRILTSYYKVKPGGYCKRLFRAICALSNRNCDVYYVALEKFPLDHENIHFLKLPWPEGWKIGVFFWAYFHCCCPVVFLYFVLKYKISHVFAFGNTYGFVLKLAACIYNIRITVFARADQIVNDQLSKYNNFIIYFDNIIESIAINNSSLVAVTNTLLNTIVSRHTVARPAMQTILYNDVRLCENYQEQYITKKTASLNIGIVGILENRKNHIFLFEAIECLRVTNLCINIYGTGPYEDFLRRYVANHHLESCVKFHGYCNAKEIYSSVDLIVLPSVHEGLSNAALECIENRIPLLLSDIVEHREIFHSDMLFDITNTQDLGRKILEFIIDYHQAAERNLSLHKTVISKLEFDWDSKIYDIIVNNEISG